MEENNSAQSNATPQTPEHIPFHEDEKPKKGFSIPKIAFLLIFFVILLVVMEGGLYLFKHSGSSTPTSLGSPKPTAQAATPDPTASWKTFSGNGFTIQFPNAWTTVENQFIAGKTFVSGEQDPTKIYNIIEIHKYPTQLYSGYTNSQWFHKINSLAVNESISDQREKRTKLVSGKTANGDPYVIFKNEPSSTARTDPFNQIRAYVLKDQTIYELVLNQYDQAGLETFKTMLSTFKFTDSTSSSTTDTSTWKTFGGKRPYTFKYPSDWDYLAKDNSVSTIVAPKTFIDSIRNVELTEGSSAFTLEIYEYDTALPPDTFKSNNDQKITEKNTLLNGINAKQYTTYYKNAIPGFEKGDTTISTVVQHNGKTYHISLLKYEHLDIYKQLLDSFKFN